VAIITAVRADLGDDLDVERLFHESIAAFGGLDLVVDTTTGGAPPRFRQAASERGIPVSRINGPLEFAAGCPSPVRRGSWAGPASATRLTSC
jgi:hypothetical protein